MLQQVVVDHDDHQFIRGQGGEGAIEPRHLFLVDVAIDRGAIRRQLIRVEANEPQAGGDRAAVVGAVALVVAKGPVEPHKLGLGGASSLTHRREIMVTRNHIGRIGQLGQTAGQPAVVIRLPVLGQVAGNQQKIQVEVGQMVKNLLQGRNTHFYEMEPARILPNGLRQGHMGITDDREPVQHAIARGGGPGRTGRKRANIIDIHRTGGFEWGAIAGGGAVIIINSSRVRQPQGDHRDRDRPVPYNQNPIVPIPPLPVSPVRVRDHVNPLSRRFSQPVEPPDWSNIYQRPEQPLHLDIGCARGIFALEMARQDPTWNFLGIEIRHALVDRANLLRQEANLTNLHYLFCNANNSVRPLMESLPAGIVRRVTIQFPDPWFKKRHQKRRVVQPALVEELAEFLEPGADLFLQSDIEEVAVEMRDRFDENPNFERVYVGDWCGENPLPIRTEREQYVLAQDLPVYRARFQRR